MTHQRKVQTSRPMVLIATVAVLAFTGTYPALSADKKPLGLAVANLQVDPFNVIKNSVEEYAESKGYEVVTVDARGDSAAQVSQVQDLLTRGIGALIYIPAGATAASVPVQAAHSAGVPVIAVDRNPPDAPGDTFIANDSVKSAKTLGEYVCKVTGGKGNVAIIQGQVGTTPELDRGKGFDEAIAECPGLKVVATQPTTMWMQDEGFNIAQDMLQRDPSINVIFGRADSIALGALQAVKVANLDHKVWIVGHDGDKGALASIKAGEMTATMAQPFVKMGQMAVDASIELMGGKTVDKIQLLNAPLVNKDNVDQIIADGAKYEISMRMVSTTDLSLENRDVVLGLSEIGKAYQNVTVLSSVSFDIARGEVLALLGENGAGKSTLSSIIAGSTTPSNGGMQWMKQAYAPASPGDAIAAGIGMIHQELKLLPDMSVAENIFIGRFPVRGGMIDRSFMNRRASELLGRLGLDIPPTRLVGELRVAAQQQVEIAKALNLNAKLLILDEPTSSLGAEETDRLFEQIRQLKAEGMSFVYITHRMEEIPLICDRIAVLRDGRLISTYDHPDVEKAVLLKDMVGRSVDRIFPAVCPLNPAAPEMLRVENLTAAEGMFKDVSFTVKAGEILGVAGLVGAGRTEVMRAVAGADLVASGRVLVQGQEIQLGRPIASISAGMGFVPEDRRQQGIILDQTIAENVALPSLRAISSSGWVVPARLEKFCRDAITSFGIKGTPHQKVGHLSGGNQQKVVIGKWAARNPKIFILDEPTRGIDVNARASIYEMIVRFAEAGAAVIVVSSDLEEVLGLSHRVLIMRRGQVATILEREEVNALTVMSYAA